MEKLTKCSVTNPNIGSHGKEILKKKKRGGGVLGMRENLLLLEPLKYVK